jgi:ubiquinone/menaquinone biosynthesis C-methylase UbiE
MLSISKNKKLKVYKADLLGGLPFSDNKFDAIISISVINFITEGIKTKKDLVVNIKKVRMEIYRLLKNEGRAVVQFFKNKTFESMLSSEFKKTGFTGYIVIDNKNLRSEKRFFVLDKSE